MCTFTKKKAHTSNGPRMPKSAVKDFGVYRLMKNREFGGWVDLCAMFIMNYMCNQLETMHKGRQP